MCDREEVENELQNAALPVLPRTKSRFRQFVRARLLSPLVCSVMASMGIFGGISSMLIGLVCVIIHALISGDIVFGSAGTAFLIAAIPAILIGSIFLDEIEPKKS